MKLNNKGFTLVEVLAVVVILAILTSIAVPTVGRLITRNREEGYEKLKTNIMMAAKNYFSDYRYDISVDTSGSCDGNNQRDVLKIQNHDLNSSKLQIKVLIEMDYINETIKNPKDNTELNLDNSYVGVKFNCRTKDYDFLIEDSDLIWK